MLQLVCKKVFILKGKLISVFRLFNWYYLTKVYNGRFKYGNTIVVGAHCSVTLDWSTAKINIGNGVQFRNDCHIRAVQNGDVKIGDNVFFNNQCSITSLQQIHIGNNCQFGEGVKIYDHNHRYQSAEKLIAQQGYTTAPVLIGNNCWLGSHVIVLKGVSIGEHAVIGAGVVVYKDVPAHTVLIGKQ
jgi:acetyltransferase-like isoleucine patch superfamily enzyme